MIKRMLLSSLSLVFLILALFLIFGREEEVVGCFPTAELEAASLAALRAEVSIAKELQAAPCAEADSSRKQLYEEIRLARLERILVPLSDFGGRELSRILVDEQEVCYIYPMQQERHPRAGFQTGRLRCGVGLSTVCGRVWRRDRNVAISVQSGTGRHPFHHRRLLCRSVCAKTTRAIPFPI